MERATVDDSALPMRWRCRDMSAYDVYRRKSDPSERMAVLLHPMTSLLP